MKCSKSNVIAVTGAAGYIGSVLVRRLLADGYTVRAIDSLRWGGDALVELADHPRFAFFKTDICDRGRLAEILPGCRGVVHLAAIVGDPACKAEPELARRVNVDGSSALFNAAEQAGCQRFVFISTCSNYGRMADAEAVLDEEATLAPVSLYAETKVSIEQLLLNATRERICRPTVLRFATAYGVSPRMRFDLTVNEFMRDLCLGRELVVYGEQFWRPYCHVQDLSRAICRTLESRLRDVAFEVFNVGDSAENYTKKMLLEHMVQHVADPRIRYVEQADDPRDYRVCCDKIHRKLSFHLSKRIPNGIRELAELVKSGVIVDPDAARYTNGTAPIQAERPMAAAQV